MLITQEYARQGKEGLARSGILSKVAGLNLAQITRLIPSTADRSNVKLYRRHWFASKYTRADLALLTELDRAHERLSELKREFTGNWRPWVRAAGEIFVSKLYNLSRSVASIRAGCIRIDPSSGVFITQRRPAGAARAPGYL